MTGQNGPRGPAATGRGRELPSLRDVNGEGVSHPTKPPTEETSALQVEVADRFGVLPNFFCLGGDAPEITANLWGFAKFAYLDNPLPSLFKERLFAYLSRFCIIR